METIFSAIDDINDMWVTRMNIPNSNEIANYNRISTSRSPYIVGWLKTGGMGRFTQFAIDFKADFLPEYTYCSLCNFYLDYSSLSNTYSKIYSQVGLSGYAGFQRGDSVESKVGILSFWNTYCEDENGNKIKIKPIRVYPENDDNNEFSGEGEGVHCLAKYEWEQGKWYRMLLQCGISETTSNTTVEQWVQNLETKNWVLLSKYDIGIKNVAFINDSAVFLENFNSKTSGEIRTMEVKNIRICLEGSEKWTSIRSANFCENYDYPGSYKYGTDTESFWIITTGISNKAGMNNDLIELKVSEGENTSPF